LSSNLYLIYSSIVSNLTSSVTHISPVQSYLTTVLVIKHYIDKLTTLCLGVSKNNRES